jgi:CBS domain-containing protein
MSHGYRVGPVDSAAVTVLRDVMRTDYISVEPHDTLGEVAQRLVDARTGAAIVKDFGRMIGILTERDMLKAMAGRVHTSEARVREWMTADPITATPDTATDAAAQTMVENGFRHLPVVEDGAVVGVVSLRRMVAHGLVPDTS